MLTGWETFDLGGATAASVFNAERHGVSQGVRLVNARIERYGDGEGIMVKQLIATE